MRLYINIVKSRIWNCTNFELFLDENEEIAVDRWSTNIMYKTLDMVDELLSESGNDDGPSQRSEERGLSC